MRGTALGVASVTALVLAASPVAASAATRVDGDHFARSGARVVHQGCANTTEVPGKPPRLRIKKGDAALGSRSIAWDVATTGFGIGPTAYTSTPSTADDFSLRVKKTAKRFSYVATVEFDPSDEDGVWRGTSAVNSDAAAGWHRISATDAQYSWLRYVDGSIVESAAPTRLAEFVQTHGGDGEGAFVGYALGCDGNSVLVDGLRVSDGGSTRTLNFEGFGTRSLLTKGTKTPKRIKMTFGQQVKLEAKLRAKVGSRRLAGPVKFESKFASAKRWNHHQKFKVPKSGKTLKLGPSRSSVYRMRYAGTKDYEGSRSHSVKILVRSQVNAGLADSSIVKGKRFTAAGRVLPKRRAKVLLQRFVDGHWKTYEKSKSGHDGRFRLTQQSIHIGKSYWRVVATSGGGNLSNHSQTMRLNVKAPPPPPHTGGGGGNGGGNNEPPPPDPPPTDDPPPPSH